MIVLIEKQLLLVVLKHLLQKSIFQNLNLKRKWLMINKRETNKMQNWIVSSFFLFLCMFNKNGLVCLTLWNSQGESRMITTTNTTMMMMMMLSLLCIFFFPTFLSIYSSLQTHSTCLQTNYKQSSVQMCTTPYYIFFLNTET